MKTLAALLSLTAFIVCTPSVHADTGGHVLEVDGEVLSDGARAPAAGTDLEDGAILVAATGARVRVSIPGVGEVQLVGPAAARLGHADGVASFTLLRGTGSFAYEGGGVRLAVEGGRLQVSGVNGRSATLARGAQVWIEDGGTGAEVTVRAGSALFSGALEHVLLRPGDAREFGAPRSGARSLLLSGHEIDLQMPTEVVLEGRTMSPALEELQDSWNPVRESPRIP